MKMKVTLTQHPVGQGGLMSGLLESDIRKFHWLYDCGSNQLAPLNREIENLAEGGDVDVLFLSHLDSDHVNGIDRLLARTTVREVVLPYLNDMDRIVAAAHDLATGRATVDFFQFLGGIEAWFGARNVGRVTYVRPRGDDEDEDGNPRSVEPPNTDPSLQDVNEAGAMPAAWQLKGQYSPPIERRRAERISPRQGVEIGAYLQTSLSGARNWLFIPYAHRPSDKKLQYFKAALNAKFSALVDHPEFPLVLLEHADTRSQLRDCYDAIWSSHNLVSMSLYAGPVCPGDSTVTHSNAHPHWLRPHGVAWLSTGDMHLNVRGRRDAFLAFYKNVLETVHVFGLPHHGSYRNFDRSLLRALATTEVFLAAAGPNGHGHPSPEVVDVIEARGKCFHQVSDQPDTELCFCWDAS